jgi:dihydrolipoamide dehydrogenase
MTASYDVIVIGGGPAGYAAAIRCAQLGLNTACIDDWKNRDGQASLGGTCLNAGCIPSKALLESSQLYAAARQEFSQHGIHIAAPQLDLETMMARKNRVVSELTQGIAALFKSNHIAWLTGRGRLLPNKQVEFSAHTGEPRLLQAEHVVLAAGSLPSSLGAAPVHGEDIVDSTGALAFSDVPKRLGVIGAGVIGLELGSVWRRLGAEVILLEAQDAFLTIADEQVAQEALRQFTTQGLDIRLGARVVDCPVRDDRVDIKYEDKNGTHQETVDKLIVSVGRRPNTQGLFSVECGLLLDEWGYVHVDERCRTNLPGVYAIGDVVRGPMLAHKGSEEGIMVAETLAGRHARVNYDTIPCVIYTLPEIAWAGKTEQALKAAGEEIKIGQFPFAANGRARALGATAGFIKILADAKTDRVCGVHMIGPQCSELIAIAVTAMEFGASSEDIAMTMFAHPSLSEVVHEAALSVGGRAIHVAQRKKRT